MEERFDKAKIDLLKLCSQAPEKFLALELQISMESETLNSNSEMNIRNVQLDCIKKNATCAIYYIDRMGIPSFQLNEYLAKINKICSHMTIDYQVNELMVDKLEFRELHWIIRAVLEIMLMFLFEIFHIKYNITNQLEELISELKYQLKDKYVPSAYNEHLQANANS
jgi:hypothetical protein